MSRRPQANEARHDVDPPGTAFTAFDDSQNLDCEQPFSIIPDVCADEWSRIERGLLQRLTALNMFLADLYNEQHVIREGVIPGAVLDTSRSYRPECRGMRLPVGAWGQLSGTELVRGTNGTVYVLRDNLRAPSGAFYLLESPEATRLVPSGSSHATETRPIEGYVRRLRNLLVSLAPDSVDDPSVVVLTPGIHETGHFEHCYLARRMGVDLVEGCDLVTHSNRVYKKAINGLERVHVICHGLDDNALDPEVFDPDSRLGCRGLFRAWRKGNVVLTNAPGSGVADDALVYRHVPDLIQYYLHQDPIIPNAPTHGLYDAASRGEAPHLVSSQQTNPEAAAS